ncbi:MAG: BrnT family toxin [Bosea sp.]|nr:BrnT family toxin [Bosea sp. (in: a-proteobacteria)]
MIGELEGRIFAVIFTMRGDTIRIITPRRARNNEERAYRESHPGQGEGWPH